MIIHDSMQIKDISLFDKVFALDGNVQLSNHWQMCLGKFVLNTLPELPNKPIGKLKSIYFENSYFKPVGPDHKPFPLLTDTNTFVEKHGKKRMVIENELS